MSPDLHQTAEEDAAPKGAPTWMVTYGDTVTLLLTFFVLLLTFSTPNTEDYGELSRGLLEGSQLMGLSTGSANEDGLAPQDEAPLASKLDDSGAETPPTSEDVPLKDLTHYYEDIDVSTLDELRGAQQVRIPLAALFEGGSELRANGRKILDHIAKMTRSRAYSVVVRARAAEEGPTAEGQARSVALGLRVVAYLRARAGDACPDIGLSDNVELSRPPLPPGHCDVILLEV